MSDPRRGYFEVHTRSLLLGVAVGVLAWSWVDTALGLGGHHQGARAGRDVNQAARDLMTAAAETGGVAINTGDNSPVTVRLMTACGRTNGGTS